MTSTRPDPGSGLRTTVTRIHAVCLFAITIATTIASTIGWKGRGPLDVLASQPYGYVGLVQAYFLMFLLALVCLIGATRWPSRLWNAALLGAHRPPWTPHDDPRLDALADAFALLLNPGTAAAAAPTHTLPATATATAT